MSKIIKGAVDESIANANDGIVVNDPQVLRPTELPLVVELPETASAAQVAFAKILNAYAYQNPAKWAIKKAPLIAELRRLANAPAPVESNLKIGRPLPKVKEDK